MSVLQCSRPNCDNIMCSTYIPNIGYICSDCQTEFKELTGDNPTTFEGLKKFMSTNVGSTEIIEDIDKYFSDYTN